MLMQYFLSKALFSILLRVALFIYNVIRLKRVYVFCFIIILKFLLKIFGKHRVFIANTLTKKNFLCLVNRIHSQYFLPNSIFFYYPLTSIIISLAYVNIYTYFIITKFMNVEQNTCDE